MIRRILRGWICWKKIKLKYRINYKKVIVVLSDENHELDRQAILHLPDFMERKHAKSAVVLCKEDCEKEWSIYFGNNSAVSVDTISDKKMMFLYLYYSFIKFFDNIVFTYVDVPEDNLLGTYLKETEVNEEDAACLALYHLRYVPSTRR